MNHRTTFAILTTAVACAATPTIAFASGPPASPGAQKAAHDSNQSDQQGSSGNAPSQAKAYGRYCKDQGKTHVAGQKGTPFSQCVTAMAKLASGKTGSPQAACASMSKAHTAGEQGTPFSRCVTAGAKLLKNQHK